MLQRIFPVFSGYISCSTLTGEKKLPEQKSGEDFPSNQFTTKGNATVILSSIDNVEPAESMLLQAAITCNTEGSRVVYIAPAAFTRLPRLVHGMPAPDPVLMNRVKMLYVDDLGKLINFLADMHKSQVLPDVVIIQDLDWYILPERKSSQMHSLARLSALVIDAANLLASKISTFSHVLISINDISGTYLQVCKTIFTEIWILKGFQDHQLKVKLDKDVLAVVQQLAVEQWEDLTAR